MAQNDCPHNSGVTCAEWERHCPTCGWSPEGEARRRGSKPKIPMPSPDQPARRNGGHPRRVDKVNEEGAVLETYPTLVAAAVANNMDRTVVKNHCQGKLKHPFKCTGGYTFRYAD